jgi:hypothetical protein
MSAATEPCGKGIDLGDQLLDQGLNRRRAELQLAGQGRDGGIERIAFDDLVDQTDAQRGRRVERAAVHQELARHARADRLDQHRDGDGRQQAVAHRGEAKARRGGGNGKVAGQHQADAAAHRRAVHPGDRGLGEIVDRLHRAHHRVSAGVARDRVELRPGQHPVEIAARREDLALAGQHQNPHRPVGGEASDRVADRPGGVGIQGVHRLAAAKTQGRDAVFDGRQDRFAHLDHIRKTPNLVGPIGWFIAAERASASAMRVSTGSRMPSSQMRAVA